MLNLRIDSIWWTTNLANYIGENRGINHSALSALTYGAESGGYNANDGATAGLGLTNLIIIIYSMPISYTKL